MAAAPTASEIIALREALVAADPALATAHAQAPAFAWRARPGGYEGLVNLIIEQQVSLASAAAIRRRVIHGLGGRITPEAVLAQDVGQLRGLGLSMQKARYVHEIALAQAEGRIDFAGLKGLDDAAATQILTALTGVGRWTAAVFLMICEGRRDIFPAGDIALQEAIRWADGRPERPREADALARAERWRPHRSAAAHLLWAWYGTVRKGPASEDLTGEPSGNLAAGAASASACGPASASTGGAA